MKFFKTGALLAALLAATAAQAGTMVLDDFEKATGSNGGASQANAWLGASSVTTGSYTIGGVTVGDRKITINSASNASGNIPSSSGIQAVSAQVASFPSAGNGSGQLLISNNGGVSSKVTVDWTGIAYSLPAAMTAYEVTILYTKIDTGTVTVNGVASTTRNVGSYSATSPVSLGISAGALGSTYSFYIDSGSDTDAYFDSLSVKYTCKSLAGSTASAVLGVAANSASGSDGCTAAGVPLPGSVALLGLGLVGLGLVRRRAA